MGCVLAMYSLWGLQKDFPSKFEEVMKSTWLHLSSSW